ncbi:methylated-DNA--[protein]-cysteine S-methyltransferase [Candidatus Berkiella cookevillensis]|uniref:methylated-DNA--[protein]-cysteine S-methyltransferase n=1 Tax=Candidatus Berkiella cookevillensis TaxID=437022 RepID=A0A0Q9YEX3_9GAMM|nr:methylated-DNA--[protein]-cysteine S-methyltransferase [Candidatus Berkiella cookevillensis]MCS5709418.1 methylated-DNA--[protein]-cysteine S-methyltransferase [Candidatus Berkiella cookevillensis]
MQRLSLQTPIGYLALEAFEDRLCQISFIGADEAANSNKPPHLLPNCLTEASSLLLNYFEHKKPIMYRGAIPPGTPFQRKVWQALITLPFATTISYGDLALRLQTSARAVGNACRENPLPVIIPCHRVVSKQGLGGYAGFTAGEKMNIKKWLLKHEQTI